MIRFIQSNGRWLLGGFLLTFFSSFGQTFFIGLSGTELRGKFALSDGEFGLMYMAATLASAGVLPFLGRILDFWPVRAVVALVIPSLAGACVLIAFAPSFALALVAIFLLRLFGQGMMTHIALTQTGRWFEAARGRAISLVVPGHQAGEAILPIAFVATSALVGWQSAWLLAAAALLLCALPGVLILYGVEREPERAPGSEEELATLAVRDWTRAEVVRDPWLYVVLTGVLAPAFIGTTVFFHQDYLIELRGFHPLSFATAFPLMAATTILFALVCGALVDRLGAVRILPVFLIPLCLATASAALLTQSWSIYVFMVLLGMSYGFSATLFGALWPEIYGTAHLGSIRAVIVSSMVFATALGPGLTGALIDTGVALPQQLMWMSAWCLAGAALLTLASRALRRRAARVSA